MEWATSRSENSERLPLLTTKLHVVRTRPDAVPRPRLLAKLDEGCRRKLTIVSAPAGFGKTTLLGEWAHSGRQNVAWMSIDEGDNIPVRFWTYFIGALQRLRAGIGAAAVDSLYSLQPPPIEVILTSLINDLALMPGEIALVLDDYHAIDLEPIHSALSFFIEHIPSQIHLIITSRTEPPLKVTRLRARGDLAEIRAADLRFTPLEAAELLANVAGSEISTEDISRLAAQTEGWGAGLQLTGLAMQGRRHANGTLRAVTGTHRYVADYIIMEILERQPDAIRSFLLRTSILDRLNGSLCDAVTLGQGGEEMLRKLERANLFICPLEEDEEWYRYHNLFAEVLRERLRQLFPAEVEALHRRASMWYQEQGLMQEAIQHMLKGNDIEQAIRLAEMNAEQMLATGRLEPILQWREVFPVEEVRQRPRLALAFAWALVLSAQPAAAEIYIEYCQRYIEPDPNDGLSDITGHITTLSAFLAASRTAAEHAPDLPEKPERQVPGSTSSRIFNLETVSRSGEPAEAESPEASQQPTQAERRERFGLAEALPRMARLQMNMGQLQAALETYQQAMDQADGSSPADDWRSLARCHTGLGEIFYERNDLDNATLHMSEALKLSKHGYEPAIIHDAYTLLGCLHHARGDMDGTFDAITEAEHLLQSSEDTESLLLSLATHRIRAAIAQGNVQAAVHWAQERRLDRTAFSSEPDRLRQLVLAKTALSQYRPEEALELLAPLLQFAEMRGLNDALIRGLVLQALAFDQQGDAEQAYSALMSALRLAEPEGYVRTFTDEGLPVLHLLRALRDLCDIEDSERRPAIGTAYLDKLLDAFGVATKRDWEMTGRRSSAETTGSGGNVAHPESSAMHELLTPVSEREIEVLKLISEGKTNSSIADSLFISLSTVKTHINNLYSKLGVESRTQALARAREFHLI